MRTDFLSKLYRSYSQTGENPCEKYKYFDSSKWEGFVASRSTNEALAKSAKARLSAQANQNPARLGRSGYRGLNKKFNKVWPQLVESNPELKDMQSRSSQLWVAARRKKDPQTGEYDIKYYNETISKLIDAEKQMKCDKSYDDKGSNPLTQTFGPEHGGRTRAFSSIIGKTQLKGDYLKSGRNMVDASLQENLNWKRHTMDASPSFHSSSCAPRESNILYPDIEAYPTCDRYLDDIIMHKHCVKVHVDYVHQEFLYISVPEECKKDEIMLMKDTVNMFVQWPRRAIKILNASTNSASQQFQTPFQTHVDAYVPEMQHSPKAHHQLEANDDFLADTGFLDEVDNDVFLGIGLNAYKEPQTHLLQQQNLMRAEMNAIPKPQSRQSKSKQTRVKQSKAKGKGKHAEASGMFPTEHSSVLDPEALLQLFVNEWVDLTIVFLFTSYFYEVSSKKPNPCAFLNANTIAGDWCKSHRAEAEEHISSLDGYHADKEYFLAPYLANGHWTLFIIAPRKAQVYILDSLMTRGGSDQSCYLLSQVIESAFSEINFTWTMIQCKQQAFD